MFEEVFNWFISSFLSCVDLMKQFSLSTGITFFGFLIFLFFARILISILDFIKQIKEITNEDSTRVR